MNAQAPSNRTNRRRPARAATPPADEAATADGIDAATRSLSLVEQSAGEVAKGNFQAGAIAEIQASIIMAIRFPRNEDDAYSRLMKACERPTFQLRAVYKYPRGGKEIKGPSVILAREFARLWGNVRYGFYVVFEDHDRMQVRGYAWDLQTNDKIEQDAMFSKLIYRKDRGWIKPDERDLRELVNKHGAICERNCLLKLLPPYFVEDAMHHVESCLVKEITDSLDQSRRNIITAFATFPVLPSQLESYLGRKIVEATAQDIAELRQIYASIRDGNTTWQDYAGEGASGGDGKTGNGKSDAPNAKGGVTLEDLTRQADAKKAADDAARSQPVGTVNSVGPVKETEPPAAGKRKGRGRKKDEPAAAAKEPASPFERYMQGIAAATSQAELDKVMDAADNDRDNINEKAWDALTDAEEARKGQLVKPAAAAAAPSAAPQTPTRPINVADLKAWYIARLTEAKGTPRYDAVVEEMSTDDTIPEDAFNALQMLVSDDDAAGEGEAANAGT